MDKKFLVDGFAWGVVLWFIGYVLGFVLFTLVPVGLIGWVIMPIGILITLWVLIKKISPPEGEASGPDIIYYLKIAIVWVLIAVVFDYLFLVLLLKPADGYYKLDVYFYYATTFALPLIVGFFKTKNKLG